MGACNAVQSGPLLSGMSKGTPPIFYDYAVHSEQGKTRATHRRANQDRVCAHVKFTRRNDRALFGVFDGHGQEGEHLADFVMQRLPEELEHELKNYDRPMEEIAKAAFASCAKALREKYAISMRSGTTAAVVFIDGTSIWTFNVGDSRAVIAQRVDGQYRALPVSRDHSADDPEERDRVESLGAQVAETRIPHLGAIGSYRVVIGPVAIAMTRAFGDFACGAPISPIPEVRCHKFVEGQDLALILASDGVWTFMENQNVMHFALEAPTAKEACANICEQAALLWEQDGRVDDISICAVFFNGHKPLPKSNKSCIYPLQLIDERRKVVFDRDQADEFRKLVEQVRATTDPMALIHREEVEEVLAAFDEQLAQTEPRPELDSSQQSLLPLCERSLRIPLNKKTHGVYGIMDCMMRCDSNHKLRLTCRVAILKPSGVLDILTGTVRQSVHVLRKVERELSRGHFTIAHNSTPICHITNSQHDPVSTSRRHSEMNLEETLIQATSSITVNLDHHGQTEQLVIALIEDEESFNNADRKLSVTSITDPNIEAAAEEAATTDLAKAEAAKAKGTEQLPREFVALLPASYKRNLSITESDGLEG